MTIFAVLYLGLACYQDPRKLHEWNWWRSSLWKSLLPQISQDTPMGRGIDLKKKKKKKNKQKKPILLHTSSLEFLTDWRLVGWLIGPSLWPGPDLPSASGFLEKPAGRHGGSDLMVVLAMWVVSITGSSWGLSESLAFALWETNYYLTRNLE